MRFYEGQKPRYTAGLYKGRIMSNIEIRTD